jgi:hypothetical protein
LTLGHNEVTDERISVPVRIEDAFPSPEQRADAVEVVEELELPDRDRAKSGRAFDELMSGAVPSEAFTANATLKLSDGSGLAGRFEGSAAPDSSVQASVHPVRHHRRLTSHPRIGRRPPAGRHPS